MAGKYGTPYAETEALVAVMRHDEAEMNRILDEMFREERGLLRGAARILVEEVDKRNRRIA